jgi:hypothetical protein
MRSAFCLFLSICLFTSCTQKSGTAGNKKSIDDNIRKEVLSIAETYAKDQLKEPKKTISENGIIIIGDEQKRYVIDPSKIVVGLIDEGTNEDAIVSITSYEGQFQASKENLILIKSNNKFNITKVLEGDMKVLEIKDGIIYIEIPKLAPDAPNYNCAICREVVKYKYINGDIVRTE